MELIDKSATELLDLLAGGETSSAEIVRAHCDRIEQVEPRVGAFLHHDRDRSLECAERIDARRANGEPLGRLAGIPIAIKDVICSRGEPVTCGSKILEGFVPPYDAHVVDRLLAEDAVPIGRLNMDEFAMGSSTENSAYKITRNPWNLDRIPGGSSGGSAAAVAARQTPISLGSDTGGSIRQPAAYCGIAGLKPTYGRVSRYGLVAYASSLDQIGPLARNVEDLALLLEAIAGHDRRDSTSVDRPVPNYRESVNQPIDGLRVGIVPEHFGEGLDPEVESAVREAIDVLKSAGATVKEIDLPNGRHGIPAYYLVAMAEASSNLARYDGVHYGARAESFDDMIGMYSSTRGQCFGPEVKRRIMLGTFALSAGYRDAYYVKALQVRRLVKDDYDKAFAEVDVIAGPVCPTPAFAIGEKVDDPLAMYLTDVYTVGSNLAGIPGLSVPCGFSNSGLPIGLHLQANAFEEETLLRAGRMVERATDWHARRAEA